MFPKAYVIAGFLQDDWRVRSNLTLNLGLRYDVEIIKGIPDWPAGTDKNNLDPRVGFAWDPKGDQKWSVRGGFGRFTQQYAIFTIVKGGVGGRNGQVTVSLTPTDPLFPTFPNALPAFPPGAVLPPRDIQEISPDLENEHAWTGSIGFQRQLGPRTSLPVDANINRGVKHGFLDMNQAQPIPKDVLNAALAPNPNATIRTQAQADATRPILPVPNGFRRMDLLTNEGRSWYQGVRIAVAASDHAAGAHGVLHALEGGGSSEPLVLARKQLRSRARSRADRCRHATQPGRPAGRGTSPAAARCLSGWRLSAVSHHQSGSPYTIRYAGDPTGGGLTGGCSNRGCQSSQPGARNTERGKFINYADMTLARTFSVGPDRIEIRADMFNVFNNQNLLAGGYIGPRRERDGSASTRAEPTSSPGGNSSSRPRIGSDA